MMLIFEFTCSPIEVFQVQQFCLNKNRLSISIIVLQGKKSILYDQKNILKNEIFMI